MRILLPLFPQLFFDQSNYLEMMPLLKRAVNKIYAFLFPDAIGEYSATFRYKLIIVLLVMILSSTAACTIVYFKN